MERKCLFLFHRGVTHKIYKELQLLRKEVDEVLISLYKSLVNNRVAQHQAVCSNRPVPFPCNIVLMAFLIDRPTFLLVAMTGRPPE